MAVSLYYNQAAASSRSKLPPVVPALAALRRDKNNNNNNNNKTTTSNATANSRIFSENSNGFSTTDSRRRNSITDSQSYQDLVYRIQGDGGIRLALAASSTNSYPSYYVPAPPLSSYQQYYHNRVMGQTATRPNAVGDSSTAANGKKRRGKNGKTRNGRFSEFQDVEKMRMNYMAKGRMMANSDDEYESGDDDNGNEAIGTEGDQSRTAVRFELFDTARRIIDAVIRRYGSGDAYLDATYGPRISYVEATERLLRYLYDNNLDGAVTVIWSKKLACSALMVAKGHSKRPENRKYVLYIKDSEDNPYLREQGIYCLINHEVFTHYIRFFNDGLQAWGANRKRFDLKPLNSVEFADTEEGLAVLHSMLGANEKYLFLPALSYYTACMATKMTFDELYRHLADYIISPDVRWKYCMRATSMSPGRQAGQPVAPTGTRKMGIANGKDQVYFSGAVAILQQVQEIDFKLMLAGKIALVDLPRIQRIARLNCIRIPEFMKAEELYKSRLIEIAVKNELVDKPSAFPAIRSRAKKHSRLNNASLTHPFSSPALQNNPNGGGGGVIGIVRSNSTSGKPLRRQKSEHQMVLQHSIEPTAKNGSKIIANDEPDERVVRTWKKPLSTATSMPTLPSSDSAAALIGSLGSPWTGSSNGNHSGSSPRDSQSLHNSGSSNKAAKKALLKKLNFNPVNARRFKSKVVFSNLSSSRD